MAYYVILLIYYVFIWNMIINLRSHFAYSHVQADEAYCIGPPPSNESYLRQDKIIQVAKRTGAQVSNN